MDSESGQCVRMEERHAADGLGIRTMCPSGGATCISLDSESGQCVRVEERHAFRWTRNQDNVSEWKSDMRFADLFR